MLKHNLSGVQGHVCFLMCQKSHVKTKIKQKFFARNSIMKAIMLTVAKKTSATNKK